MLEAFLLVLALPFAIPVYIGTYLIIGTIAEANPAPEPNAHEKHAERLYWLSRKQRPSLLSRIIAPVRDTRDWQQEFQVGSEWWHGGSLIVVEGFNGRRLAYRYRNQHGPGTLKHIQWTRLVRA